MVEEDAERPERKLIEAAAEVVGGLAGAGIGAVIAGPPGAVVGAVGAPAVKLLSSAMVDWARRRLSHRETVRVATFLDYAAERIRLNLEAGHEPRADGWFEPDAQGRPGPAEEIADAAARAARDQSEERKIPYVGNLLGNLIFTAELDRVMAHRMIRTAEALSYTQLELLAAYQAHPALLPDAAQTPEARTWDSIAVNEELTDLGFTRRSLISIEGKDYNATPARQVLTGRGSLLAALMDLGDMPLDDVREAAAPLWGGAGLVPPWKSSAEAEAARDAELDLGDTPKLG